MRANCSQGARRQAQNHDRKRGASRHAAKGTAMAARKGRRSCGLPRKFGPHEQLLSHLPTYRPSHPSHLLTSLLPDVSPYLLFLPFANRTCAPPHAVSSAVPPRMGTPTSSLPAPPPIVQQGVDARARRSLSKTLTLSCSEDVGARARRSAVSEDVDVSEASCGTPRPCVALRFLCS